MYLEVLKLTAGEQRITHPDRTTVGTLLQLTN